MKIIEQPPPSGASVQVEVLQRAPSYASEAHSAVGQEAGKKCRASAQGRTQLRTLSGSSGDKVLCAAAHPGIRLWTGDCSLLLTAPMSSLT